MKKFLFILLLSISAMSCEKDEFISNKDIPDWLKTQISGLEQEIKADPTTLQAYTAWVRYEWKKEYYFEYINPPSSFHPLPNCMDGKNLDSVVWDIYEKEKCCMKYVWKGPKY
jgi:hypothetical protein